MAKFYGPIGYAISTETRPGFWEDVIEEHTLFGDVLRDGIHGGLLEDHKCGA